MRPRFVWNKSANVRFGLFPAILGIGPQHLFFARIVRLQKGPLSISALCWWWKAGPCRFKIALGLRTPSLDARSPRKSLARGFVGEVRYGKVAGFPSARRVAIQPSR
jgi:hypothetical protein